MQHHTMLNKLYNRNLGYTNQSNKLIMFVKYKSTSKIRSTFKNHNHDFKDEEIFLLFEKEKIRFICGPICTSQQYFDISRFFFNQKNFPVRNVYILTSSFNDSFNTLLIYFFLLIVIILY